MRPLPDPRQGFAGASRRLLESPGLSEKVRRATGHSIAGQMFERAREPRWEALRVHAAALRRHTLSQLDHYLERFIEAVEERGGRVHHAADAEEACTIICAIARSTGARSCVKAKSMVSEEIRINEALAAMGVEVVETDTGELILQLGGDAPSHITAPAIHLSADDVAKTFAAHGLTAATGGTFAERARAMCLEARRHLRRPFLTADLGLSGANLLIADRGAVLLVENEANIRLVTSLPRTHVVLASPEKLVPTYEDAAVVLSMLAASATSQRQSAYVSVIEGPLERDRQFHVVLLDGGRLDVLGDPRRRELLGCVRCGACSNCCPVYRQVGGHAYGYEISGAIGKALMPCLRPGSRVAQDLPFASSLCGACGDACPVSIPLPEHLLELRAEWVRRHRRPVRDLAFRLWAWCARSPWRFGVFRWLSWFGSRLLAMLPRLSGWSRHRELPRPGESSFRAWWRAQRGGSI